MILFYYKFILKLGVFSFLNNSNYVYRDYLIISSFPIILLIFSVFSDSFENLFFGLNTLLNSPTLLITDFLKLGGFSSTIFNASIITLINILILLFFRLPLNGITIAAIFTMFGFSFFGKNIYNIVSIYVGGYFYSKYHKISLSEIIIPIMFATSLSPVVSQISFGLEFPKLEAFFIANLTGILIGFLIIPISNHMSHFHKGYNIYNMGFAAGIFGTILAGILKSQGHDIASENIIYKGNDKEIIFVLNSFFSFFIFYWICFK